MLTTITPYWGRQETLRHFVSRLSAASVPEVINIIYCVGEPLPDWWHTIQPFKGLVFLQPEKPGKSIGHYHNLGALAAQTEWIMKLDLDAMPHVDYFKSLIPVLKKAKPREWFNGGMFYLNKYFSDMMLKTPDSVLTGGTVRHILRTPRSYTTGSYLLPQASNFICRRQDYLDLGGCDERFMGWGWEDYQQLYMLERHQLQRPPIVSRPTLANVTMLCRDQIGRPKARRLLDHDPALCLIHKWHATDDALSKFYKASSNKNREVLLDYVLKRQ